MSQVPNKKEAFVQSFCRRVVPNARPQYVQLRPVVSEPVNECFSIVPEQVASHGGKQHIGWAIWVWPKVLIEAEFHTVWKSPDGGLVDITPKPVPLERILFVKDPGRQYEGVQVNNIRQPLNDDAQTLRFIELADAVFVELNHGDLADYHGHVEPTPRLMEIMHEMEQLQMALAERYGMP